jgi:hypothetical protein
MPRFFERRSLSTASVFKYSRISPAANSPRQALYTNYVAVALLCLTRRCQLIFGSHLSIGSKSQVLTLHDSLEIYAHVEQRTV